MSAREAVFERLLKINRYHRAGRHSAVKPCHRTVEALKNRRFCYKYRFYGIPSHRCIQMSPVPIRCTHRCVFCRRAHPEELGAEGEPPVPDKRDDPETIVEESIKAHRQALSGYNPKAHPKVLPEMREEAMNPTHAAISLAGEPLLYPYIDDLVYEYRKRGFTTFIVSNGTLPRVLARMHTYPHQMYVSVTAPNERLYKIINRPIIRDGRKRYLEFLEIMHDLPTLTVMRFTLIKGLNDAPSYVKEYVKLIELAEPTYIEIKGYSYVGYSQYRMKPENQPRMNEIREFAKLIEAELGGYRLVDEHEPSRIVLLTRLPRPVKLQANRKRDRREERKDLV